MNVVAIVQARMSSTRMPGKAMAELCGMPMIKVLLTRLSLVEGVNKIVVATTTSIHDDVLVNWLTSNGYSVFRGDEQDVLSRIWECATIEDADVVVRVTADDPLKDPEIIEMAIIEFLENKDLDYLSNTIKPTYPEGLDIEVFKIQALNLAFIESNLKSEREHVTPYIWKNPNKFKIKNFEMSPDLSHWRWTVDHDEDLQFVKKIFSNFGNRVNVSFKDVIDYLNKNPDVLKINQGTRRNDGYYNSLEKD